MATSETSNRRLAAWGARLLAVVGVLLSSAPWSTSAWAVEGAAAAGPIGGSDIRSAILPSPGLYGGVVGLYNAVTGFNDGSGHAAPGLNAFGLRNYDGGAFFLYVPDVEVLGGRIGFAGFEAAGQNCGQLTTAVPRRCAPGFGDPYFEADWSRSFGQVRPPTTAGAYPIIQGLVLAPWCRSAPTISRPRR